jgi:hypothetical protein
MMLPPEGAGTTDFNVSAGTLPVSSLAWQFMQRSERSTRGSPSPRGISKM